MDIKMRRLAHVLFALGWLTAFARGQGAGGASDPIVGKWMWGKHAVEVKADRTATQEPGITGAWKFLNSDEAERKYRFVWNGGKSTEDVSLSADGNVADVRNNLDEVYEAQRIVGAAKTAPPPAAASTLGGGGVANRLQQERIQKYVKDLESIIQTLLQIGNMDFLKSVRAEHDAYAGGGTTDGYPPGAAVPGNARILRNAFESDLARLGKGEALSTPKASPFGAVDAKPKPATRPAVTEETPLSGAHKTPPEIVTLRAEYERRQQAAKLWYRQQLDAMEQKMIQRQDTDGAGAVEREKRDQGLQVLAEGVIRIVSATYGVGDQVINVTEQVRNLVGDNTIRLKARWDFSPDPAAGQLKTLTIHYFCGAKEKTVTAVQTEDFSIP